MVQPCNYRPPTNPDDSFFDVPSAIDPHMLAYDQEHGYRRCENPNCESILPLGWRAVYCSNQCALEGCLIISYSLFCKDQSWMPHSLLK